VQEWNAVRKENRLEELKRYCQVAEELKDDEAVMKATNIVLDLTVPPFPNFQPFMFLEGSSGTGKTQMAFNMMAQLRNKRLTCFLLFGKVKDRDQTIYQNFKNIAAVWNDCVDEDLKSRDIAQSPNIGTLQSKPLFVFGFICQILPKLVEKSQIDWIFSGTKETMEIEPKFESDVTATLEILKLKEKPVFFVDKCVVELGDLNRKATNQRLRFVRNVFRAVDFGIVLLGTDSRVTSIVQSQGRSNRGAEPYDWCHVICEYPRVHLSENMKTHQFGAIMENSRPYFAYLFQKTMETFKNQGKEIALDSILGDVFNKVLSSKTFFRNIDGMLGQDRLFLNAHVKLSPVSDEEPPLPAALIHRHFAQLLDRNNFCLDSSGCSNLDGTQVWKPCSLFPNVDEDILLYLLLMGGKDRWPFLDQDRKRLPYGQFVCLLNDDPTVKKYRSVKGNPLQSSNDGMFLEALLSTTVCTASHANGVTGIGFYDFMKHLMWNLQVESISIDQCEVEKIEVLNLEHFIIPFLSPPNQNWPEYLLKDKSIFSGGFLRRATNTDQVDLITDFGLYGEAKDYLNKLNLTTIKNIITRISGKCDARVHLVYTRQLQEAYYVPESKSFEKDFKENAHARQSSFFQLTSFERPLQLKQITGLPSKIQPNGTIVIFVIISEKIRDPYYMETVSRDIVDLSNKKRKLSQP